MQLSLINKQILLGVTGGIAAYKSADLVRRLREAGATVRVVMTAGAKEFITPLTMQAVSGHPVHDNLFDLEAEAAMGHIELARWADVVLVAPATADFMARLAQGEAKDLLMTLCVATKAPLAIAPAMNQGMWQNASVQTNLATLVARGIHIVGPAAGSQACGDVGMGRMVEPLDIVKSVSQLFTPGSLQGQRVLITAGPTREAIDPVRYISNASSGKMGYALAQAAMEAGADVTLVSGPVSLAKPPQVQCIDVVSAADMLTAVMDAVPACDIFIAVAAVADYRCKTIATHKMAKTSPTLTLELERNPDIVATVAALPRKPFVVGFAAETDNVIANAKSKLEKKQLDLIIANEVGGNDLGFHSDDNAATVLWQQEEVTLPRLSKSQLARELIALIAKIKSTIKDESNAS